MQASSLFAGLTARRCATVATAAAVAGAIWFGPGDLGDKPRVALMVFALAVVGWTLTGVNDTAIALAAGVALVVAGVVSREQLYAALGHELIWLLIGAFVVGAVLRETSITQRLVFAAIRPARSFAQLAYALTFAIAATAFVIPSTSARAVVLLPVFLALADALNNSRHVRALALLFPSVILLSACGSLIGAGAHVVALEFLELLPGVPRIDYLRWMLLGLPIALLSSLAAATAILHLFLAAEERRARLHIPATSPIRHPRERLVAAVVAATVVLWATAGWHGVGIAVVGLAAALVLTLPTVSGVPLQAAVKAVEWELILFLAATLLIGEALIHSQAAAWITRALLAALPERVMADPLWVAAVVASVALLAHLVIVSRSARAAVLVPTLALPVAGFGYDAAAIVLLTVMATGYSQTLAISSKPVAIYATLDRPTYDAKDLMSLSLVLLPVVLIILLVVSLWLWPWLGLPLQSGRL